MRSSRPTAWDQAVRMAVQVPSCPLAPLQWVEVQGFDRCMLASLNTAASGMTESS